MDNARLRRRETRQSHEVMFLEAVDQRNRKLAVHDIPLGNHDQSEFVVHSALDPMASEAKIDVLLTAEVHVVLKKKSHKLVREKEKRAIVRRETSVKAGVLW